MTKKFSVTLIIATYNWHEALKLVLISVKNQSVLPNLIVIADDGSTKETKELITRFKKTFETPIKHVWQEDDGFRKTKIMNKAILETDAEYIIQIDGDIILHKHFIKNHIDHAAQEFFIEGSRVWLDKKLTLIAQKNEKIQFSILSKGITNKLNSIYFPGLIKFFTKQSNDINYAIKTRGCNLSFWRKDFLSINGYNEDLKGWGLEDSELCVRFVNFGLTKKRIKFGAIQYHQNHIQNSRIGININEIILNNTIRMKSKKCTNGVHEI